MKFCYDSWNRIQSMTYPDGEVVTYGYNKGGMLKSVQGRKGMDDRTYVENITYNAYGLKESVLYGNGTYTEYQYDLLMRLSHLYSENGQGEAMQDIEYKYDSVDNITDIYNNAPMLLNGLGGDYWSHNDYDDLYRLSHAEGNWNGGQLNYLLDMQYHSNGRIERKKMYAEVMDHTGATSVTNYENGYLYNVGQPNTLEYVVDDFSGRQQVFTWDAAGNMTNHENFAEGCARHLCWDEENRLVSFADCENAGFYQYDANGERTYKLAGGIAMQNIQGHWRSYNLLDNPTLYTSPYLVATPKGYTKHYYAENERVASMIGSGGLGDITRTIGNMEDFLTGSWVGEDGLRWEEVWIPEFYEAKQEESRNHLTDVMMCAGADPIVEDNRLVELRTYWQYIQDEGEHECYWYHPDHLGSSSWITEKGGYSAQHLHYLPWGENFVDQRTTNYAARYTFSAKEKDAETGYSYFGARYYNSDLSIWLSVDPQASKYPSLSPYVYCADNPVKLVDPNGEEIGDYYSYNGKWLGTDGVNDNKAYVATGKNPNGTFKNAKELPISNSELLDRATWVCGESGGSNEQITSRTHNVGDPTSTSDAGVADYYAFAINNASNADGGFYKAVFNRMGKMIDGKYTRTSEGYFEGKGLGGNTNSKAFARARASGMSSINADSRFTNSIAAVIKSVSSPVDPTGGCRAWLGSPSAEKYYNNAQIIYTYRGKQAVMQFSFTSNNKAFYHTFYRFYP